MQTLLEQLRTMTKIVADTGDFDSILKFKPQDSTTNPTLIEAATQRPGYGEIVGGVLKQAKRDLGENSTDKEVARLAFKRLAVAFGKKILAVIPGRVSTEVDARLSYDRAATMTEARSIIEQYEQSNVSRERILIKIASTWEGIQAAAELEKEGIHCNLTLLFGLHQGIACADANVTLISPFVGRILDWYKKNTGKDYAGADDPGVQSVQNIYEYLKQFGYRTEVMGASFRNIGEIVELAGCDLLTISPKLLQELDATRRVLTRKMNPNSISGQFKQRISIDEEKFEQTHQGNQMAREKLAEGIQSFGTALEKLEKFLAQRLSELGLNSQPELARS